MLARRITAVSQLPARRYARDVRRVAGTPELLDGPLHNQAASVALRGNLRDLRRLNRWLGGIRLSRRAVDALLGARSAGSLLDVGTGAGDIALALTDGAARRGRQLRVVAIDSRPEIVEMAKLLEPRLRPGGPVELVVGDGRSLPFGDRSFDVVHSSLVIHHLDPSDAIAFLREARRVSRQGVVINDLVRHRLHWLLALLLVRVTTRNGFTRNDGPLSVRRSYTPVETRALLAAAGLRPVAEHRGILGHRRAFAAVAIPDS